MTEQATRNTPPATDLEALRAQLEAAEKARDEYLGLAQQARADFENYQKRAQRDLATERRFAQSPLASDLLPALDNLERAIGVAEQAGDKGALAQGVAMVLTQFLDALRRHGVQRIEAQGKPFDHNLHQAIAQIESPDHPAGTVAQVVQPGYTINGRLLRPAMVAVSKGSATQPGAKVDTTA